MHILWYSVPVFFFSSGQLPIDKSHGISSWKSAPCPGCQAPFLPQLFQNTGRGALGEDKSYRTRPLICHLPWSVSEKGRFLNTIILSARTFLSLFPSVQHPHLPIHLSLYFFPK